jgi:hypothetical protein
MPAVGSPAGDGARIVPWRQLAIGIIKVSDRLTAPPRPSPTLAGFLATRAASQLHALAERTVLIRSDCTGAISDLRKGSFRSPALQNVALLHNRLSMDVGASPPHYLHAPGTVMKAGGVDDLSRAVARSIRASASTQALRDMVAAEAERWLGARSHSTSSLPPITLWSPGSSRGSRSRSRRVDALAQPNLGRSRCPHCGAVLRECVFARFRHGRCCRCSLRRQRRTGCAASSLLRSRRLMAGSSIRVPHSHCRTQGPMPDPPELG